MAWTRGGSWTSKARRLNRVFWPSKWLQNSFKIRRIYLRALFAAEPTHSRLDNDLVAYASCVFVSEFFGVPYLFPSSTRSPSGPSELPNHLSKSLCNAATDLGHNFHSTSYLEVINLELLAPKSLICTRFSVRSQMDAVHITWSTIVGFNAKLSNWISYLWFVCSVITIHQPLDHQKIWKLG